MASTCKCEYCGTTISTNDQVCPNCGASNSQYVIDTEKIITNPQTIEELKEYCAERGMPLVRMRFFIGEDYKEPKAFGIYRDTNGEVVVYKNKADGTRAVRYRGTDEKVAVNELYGKLLQECHNRGIYPDGKSNTPSMTRSVAGGYSGRQKRSSSYKLALIIFTIFGLLIVWFIVGILKHPNGYYKYGDTMYYLNGSTWFYYDETSDDWFTTDSLDTYRIYEAEKDYYQGDDWDSEWGMSYYDSDAYREYQESRYSESSDDDGGYSSDYDNWDSNDTNWDSDW